MVPKGWSVFRLEDIVIRTQLGTTERGMSEDPLTTLIPLIKMGNLGGVLLILIKSNISNSHSLMIVFYLKKVIFFLILGTHQI